MRYLYERLGEKPFQQLCNALLVQAFPDVQCYPVGHSDGGRDATLSEGAHSIVYQVKWAARPPADPVTWLTKAVNGEAKNIRRLVAAGATKYYLMTSVAGTAVPERGTMDKMNKELARLSDEFGVTMRCWWRADIDGRVDGAPSEIKWAYSEMLAGHDLIRYLLECDKATARDHSLRDLLRAVIATQWDEDAKVKFKQVELESQTLEDLFIDVEAVLVGDPGVAAHLRRSEGVNVGGAAKYLAQTRRPFTLVRGEPGQGKSTLGQYLCQRHRAAYLADRDDTTDALPVAQTRVPLRVDLRDYAAWLANRDPFTGEEPESAKPRLRAQGSLEEFLADLLHARSGGLPADVATVRDIVDRFPFLLVLDGLDEVASVSTRSRVVKEIDEFCARLQRRHSTPQVVVTARPNAAGLDEPSHERFEVLALARLSPELRSEYLAKWADARAIHGRDRALLERTFQQRSAEPHIAQLADNPMQLTILLYLLQKRGHSVPVTRTELYTSYMETFLDREAEKTTAVRTHRGSLEEVTAFLGWLLQSRAEADAGNGRISTKDLERQILTYLFDAKKETAFVKDLFTGVTDRVWALTSKVDHTFEFDVQPLREYFAARYLNDFAGIDDARFDKTVVFRHLVRRAYWLNTTRFYAGFAKQNELAGLIEGLDAEWNDLARLRQVRHAAWTLLADGVFSVRTVSQKRAAQLFLDPLSVRLINHSLDSPLEDLPALSWDNGANDLVPALLDTVSADPQSRSTRERLSLVARLVTNTGEFDAWWQHHFGAALGTPDELTWLRFGAPLAAASRLPDTQIAKLTLTDSDVAAAAVEAGAKPQPGSSDEEHLLRAVLDGHCSDAELRATGGFAQDLLCVLAPREFLRKAVPAKTPLYRTAVRHTDIGPRAAQERQAALARLKARDERFVRLQQAVKFGKGQSGTTSPWGNTARAIAALYGPCWIAAEIAVIGAATPREQFRTEGDLTRDSVPLGPDADYGRLLQNLREAAGDESWWSRAFEEYPDDLSRATWTLALLCTATSSIVYTNLDRIDEVTRQLRGASLRALMASSSRINASALGRPLPRQTFAAAAKMSTPTALLVSHRVSGPRHLEELSLRQLMDMAAYGTAAWPAVLALTTRTLADPREEHLRALAAHGPDAIAHQPGPPMDSAVATAILKQPFDYPMGWVLGAERTLGQAEEEYLADAAREGSWFSL